MLHSILTVVGAGLVWLAWEVIGDALGESLGVLTRPIRRPIWRVFVTASRSWPLMLMLLLGWGAAALGLLELHHDLGRWWNLTGIIALLGGCGIGLFAPLLWRDARRERSNRASELVN